MAPGCRENPFAAPRPQRHGRTCNQVASAAASQGPHGAYCPVKKISHTSRKPQPAAKRAIGWLLYAGGAAYRSPRREPRTRAAWPPLSSAIRSAAGTSRSLASAARTAATAAPDPAAARSGPPAACSRPRRPAASSRLAWLQAQSWSRWGSRISRRVDGLTIRVSWAGTRPCSLTLSLPGLLGAGQDRGVPLNVRDPLLAFGPAITRWNRSHRGRPEGGPDPFRRAFCPGPGAAPRRR